MLASRILVAHAASPACGHQTVRVRLAVQPFTRSCLIRAAVLMGQVIFNFLDMSIMQL